MSAVPEVVIHGNADLLAATTAARLVTKLVDVQSTGRVPVVALTGGGVGISTLAHLNDSPARDAVDWSRVEILWGDERFVPSTIRSGTPGRPWTRCWTTSRWTRPECT